MALPYDAPDSAHAAVDAAFEQARTTNKRVLIDFGANWCPDCRMLAGVMQLTPGAALDRPEHHPGLGQRRSFQREHGHRAALRRDGKAIPTVLLVTPQGRLLNADGTLVLGNARTMSSQAVVDQIAEWNRRP